MDLKETEILGADIERHWYYRSKAAATSALLRGVATTTILDVGAGSAFFSRQLLDRTSAKAAWCVDISYDQDSDELEAGKPLHLRRDIGAIDASVVLLMDVLEHVDNDVGLLRLYIEKVPSGTTFLISVPAFRFLWSEHDEFLEHKRRYTVAMLEDAVRRAGLKVERGAYYFCLVFPLVVVLRLIGKAFSSKGSAPRSQLTRHGKFVNELLAFACRLELPFFRFNRIAGLSVFCVATKP